jgi:hypothetical protein
MRAIQETKAAIVFRQLVPAIEPAAPRGFAASLTSSAAG